MELISKIIAFLNSNLVAVIGAFLFMCLEFWLGRSEYVKAGSTLEAILNGIKKVLEVLGIKKPEVK